MFFKKQAFKLKDLLKEKGIELPLVTVQEVLAKSYGFNNRHVALSDHRFNHRLNEVKRNKELKKLDRCDLALIPENLRDIPYKLTEENIISYIFNWSFKSMDVLDSHHHSLGWPNSKSPFDYKIKDGEILYIKESKGYSTILSYIYESGIFYRRDELKLFAELMGGKFTYKSFNEMNLKREHFEFLFKEIDSWNLIKKIILHKDCPIDFVEQYTTDEIWYIRLTAIFGKHHRDKLYKIAKDDKDARVRKAYYLYLFENDIESLDEVRNLLKKDFKVQALLKNRRYKNEGEEDWFYLINW
jgi:hypothetical protein